MVPSRTFSWAIVAGGMAIVALAGFWTVLFQLVRAPGNALPDFSRYPFYTVLLVLIMSLLVSSMAEEAGFRGYFQGNLEKRFSAPVAILIAAVVIAPAHGLTQGFVWTTILFYFLVDITFGTLAYLTNSILPGTIVHIMGLLVFFTLIWPSDISRRLIWDGGMDLGFWFSLLQAVIFTALAIWAFNHLTRITAASRKSKKPALN
jgi:membrane protease YdiL (CAAX protease family)